MEKEINNLESSPTVTEKPEIPTTPASTIPSFKSCLVGSWDFVMNRYELLLLVFVISLPSLYLSMMESQNENFFAENVNLSIGIFLWSIVLTPIMYMAVVYLAIHHSERPTITAAVKYVLKNFWSVVWLLMIISLVVLGGFVLLIVPGIILSGYATFATYVFVTENKRGLSALLRSHELVAGVWWGVFLRVVGISLLWGITAGIISTFGLIGWVVSGFLQAGAVLAICSVAATLYKVRAQNFDATLFNPPSRRLYQVMAGVGATTTIGFLTIVLLIAAFVLLGLNFS